MSKFIRAEINLDALYDIRDVSVGVIDAPNSNIGFGYSVAVGNFNGNAELDIVIGAPGANNGNGAVYVAFDNRFDYGAGGSSNLTTVYNSTNKGELAGYSVAVSSASSKTTFTGNTNTDDLIIGAIAFSGDVTNQWNGLDGLPPSANSTDNPAGQSFPSTSTAELGAVYVYQSNGTETLTEYVTYLGSNLPSNNGTANNSNAGYALNSTDLDGDGTNDLAISAPGGANNNGLIYVLQGGKISQNNNPQNLDAVANLAIVGGLDFSQTGTVITSPGDVNNDTYEDFLITAPQGANGTGQSYVLFGPLNLNDIGTIFDLNVTATDSKTTFLLNGDQPNQLAGAAASAIGDVNGDGVDDFMISAPNAGQLYTIYGHPWLADDGSIKLADISGDNGFVIDGNLFRINGNETILNGNNVLMLGDVNGDGFGDVLSGTWKGDTDTQILIFGNSTTNLIDAAAGTDNILITVTNQGSNNGNVMEEVLALGDINGDGLQDLGVIDNFNNFYVQLGSRNLPSLGSTISLSNPTITDVNQGFAVGDYNGDGYDDIILTNTNNISSIYFGNAQGNLSSSVNVGSGTYAPIGDLNGDGYSDFISQSSSLESSASIGYANGFNKLEIYYGNLGKTVSAQTFLNATDAPFFGTNTGKAVNQAGDFNGDGIADVMFSTAQPVGLIVVETSDSQVSFAYFNHLSIDWATDTSITLDVQTTTHTYSNSDERMGLASYNNDWFFAHSTDDLFWLSGSNISQDGENTFGTQNDYAKPQLVTANGNLYMIVAGWNSNNPYISVYDSSSTSWKSVDSSTQQDDL
ncbi:MAG: hypothetical protein D6822_02545, partial [Cyanobacteria bacterium J149]